MPEVSQLFKDVHEVDQLPEGIIAQIENFFTNYNEQAGKKFEVQERLNAEAAYQTIAKSRAEK